MYKDIKCQVLIVKDSLESNPGALDQKVTYLTTRPRLPRTTKKTSYFQVVKLFIGIEKFPPEPSFVIVTKWWKTFQYFLFLYFRDKNQLFLQKDEAKKERLNWNFYNDVVGVVGVVGVGGVAGIVGVVVVIVGGSSKQERTLIFDSEELL